MKSVNLCDLVAVKRDKVAVMIGLKCRNIESSGQVAWILDFFFNKLGCLVKNLGEIEVNALIKTRRPNQILWVLNSGSRPEFNKKYQIMTIICHFADLASPLAAELI